MKESLVGSGGGVGSDGDGVEEGSLVILELWSCVCCPSDEPAEEAPP